MQETTDETVKMLWPYDGFTVRAFEKRLGEGRLTLTQQSLIFEAKNDSSIGFDLPSLRLIRLQDVHTVELAYSVQGEVRTLSFKVECTFPNGSEREELPSRDDPKRMSLFRAITGGVVARFLADHGNARVEGLTRMTDEKFEARMKNLERNIELFPDRKQFEDDLWQDADLRKRTSEAARLEPQIWEDSKRERLLDMGATPSITVDNSFAKLDLLLEEWTNGRINPLQRAKSVAMSYKADLCMYEKGYSDGRGGSSETWKKATEKLVQFEKVLGVDILSFAQS